MNKETINKIITRLPPSPTGLLHIGTARTALFNYLFARQNNGEMLFRLEDTDRERSKKEFEKNIIEGLRWLGIDYDGEVSRQSERTELLFNPINNMSGFSLEDKYFFTPGFPQMAHPMVSEIIKKNFYLSKQKYRFTLLAQTSEDTLITLMKKLPPEIELSSLPMFKDNKPLVELSLSGFEKSNTLQHFNLFCDELNSLNIDYKLT